MAMARLQVTAVSAGIPLNLVQKWLGHAQFTTTTTTPMWSAPRRRTSPAGRGVKRAPAIGLATSDLPCHTAERSR